MEIFQSKQAVVVALICLGLCAGFALALVGMFLNHRARIRSAELEAEARNSMLAKGFSPEEIATVLNASRFAIPLTSPPDEYEKGGIAPCDVVAEDPENEWRGRALVLAASTDGNSFLLHFVGRDISENAWVIRSLIRFPASVAFGEHPGDIFRDFPFAVPVSVLSGENTYVGYVVTRREKAYVCFVDHDWSENQWVDESRLRYDVPQLATTARPEKAFLDL